MTDTDDGNRRQDFRVDDLLPMQDKPLDDATYEHEKRHIGIRSRQSSMLRNMVGNDIFASVVQGQSDGSDTSRALEALDAKLNYLIGVNMLNDANRNDLDERSVNISATGISFATSQTYELGNHLAVTLMLPALPPQVLELIGTVRRIEPAPRGQIYVGVGFTFRCNDEREQLAGYVFRRHRELIRMEVMEREAAENAC